MAVLPPTLEQVQPAVTFKRSGNLSMPPFLRLENRDKTIPTSLDHSEGSIYKVLRVVLER